MPRGIEAALVTVKEESLLRAISDFSIVHWGANELASHLLANAGKSLWRVFKGKVSGLPWWSGG